MIPALTARRTMCAGARLPPRIVIRLKSTENLGDDKKADEGVDVICLEQPQMVWVSGLQSRDQKFELGKAA